MSRSAPSGISYTFGPGAITPAVRALIYANVGVFLLAFFFAEPIVSLFGLSPAAVFEGGRLWQLGTYLFVHDPGSFGHILFNMLSLWMFGVELERRWGTTRFVKYYLVTGIGAGISTLLFSLLPFDIARATYGATTIGASGAIYGLLFAWALLFPDRQILFMFLFPLKARIAVLIMGAIAFLSAVGGRNSGVAEATHLSGLLVGWLYLKGPADMQLEIKYRLTRWRMARLRKRFDVHRGGRGDDWQNRIH